jgi:hypothetical protein
VIDPPGATSTEGDDVTAQVLYWWATPFAVATLVLVLLLREAPLGATVAGAVG